MGVYLHRATRGVWLVLLVLVFVLVSTMRASATTDYSNAFRIDHDLCYEVNNYYGMSFTRHCYGDSWQSLFAQDGLYDRDYFDAEKASFIQAQTNGKGAWAVTNSNIDNHDNSSDPYFITVYWVEDNSTNGAKLHFTDDGRALYLDHSGIKLHSAVIASPRLVQGVGIQDPSYLWGNADTQTFSISGTGDERLYYSSFPVEYPEGYNGQTIPGSAAPGAEAMDYLALGDSYSSGQGDTERMPNSDQKYYRIHTDDDGTATVDGYTEQVGPKEKCHLSTRSYPYLLAAGMNLGSPLTESTTKWQSIACAGATAWDTKELGYEDYLGQNNGNTPRLVGYDASTLKTAALNEFIPGRQKQIEFVKKYQPKVITLTMGGNDVDFGGKIFNCALWPSQCQWADKEGHSRLKTEIEYQFKNLSTLYSEISSATDNKAKIYVLGYPTFINGNPYAKCTNIFNLDSSEREMINNSIIYLNNVIKQAAKKAGAKYIDVENAFGNHRLCDSGAQHVTAVVGAFGVGSDEQQESFHPNHLGQVDIANAVWRAVDGESLLDYQTCADPTKNVCPDDSVRVSDAVVPPYFTEGPPSDGTEIHYYTLTNGTLVKQTKQYYVGSDNGVFVSESKVDITLYSDPAPLGQVTASGSGSVSAQITIPASVPAGYHTLVVRGTSPDGMPVELYQTVEVQGPNPNDIDEDGIDDSVDECVYITPLNIDADNDGIDDACDPEVNIPEQPYRVRLGDPSRTYAGQPEHQDYIYIERRVDATAQTGISGDDDPDRDGWAIVGASQGRSYSATSMPDTAPYARFSVDVETNASQPIPNLYLRAGDHGCLQYQPLSLARVETGQVRTFKLIAQGTASCRAEPANADMDHDGVPDNTEPLYIARNGDATKGEDSTRTYLFRNFYAAEAQLGISDYSPTGTSAGRGTEPIQTWNLLATSKDAGYYPIFNNLTVIKDSTGIITPYISARKHNKDNPSSNICITYKPNSLTQIKLATQSTIQLQLLKWKEVPEGVGCE